MGKFQQRITTAKNRTEGKGNILRALSIQNIKSKIKIKWVSTLKIFMNWTWYGQTITLSRSTYHKKVYVKIQHQKFNFWKVKNQKLCLFNVISDYY